MRRVLQAGRKVAWRGSCAQHLSLGVRRQIIWHIKLPRRRDETWLDLQAGAKRKTLRHLCSLLGRGGGAGRHCLSWHALKQGLSGRGLLPKNALRSAAGVSDMGAAGDH